jgi:hypothetical protein
MINRTESILKAGGKLRRGSDAKTAAYFMDIDAWLKERRSE